MNFFTTLGSRVHTALRQAAEPVVAHCRRVPALNPIINLLWPRLLRICRRIDSLVAKWEAGTLKAPRKRAPRPKTERKPAAAPSVKVPGSFGWLNNTVPGAHMAAGYLDYMLQEPDSRVRALVAAAPQAGRYFRPLCHVLGVVPPGWLKLPKRPRKPRPPKPPRPESRTAMIRRWRGMTGAELAAEFGRLPPHFNLPIPGYQTIRRKIRAFEAAGGVCP